MALSTEAHAAATRLIEAYNDYVRLHNEELDDRYIYPNDRIVLYVDARSKAWPTGFLSRPEDVELLTNHYIEAGKTQRASREAEPGHDLVRIMFFPRDITADLWMVQPVYKGVGQCGITTLKPSNTWMGYIKSIGQHASGPRK